jgi:hypothetical protein
MILFHPIVEIFDLADLDRGPMGLVVAPDRRGIGLATINGDFLGDAMATNGLDEEAQGCPFVPLLRQEEIDGLIGLSTVRSR